MITIQTQPIDESSLLSEVRNANAGAIVLFVGTTREITGEQRTLSLKYAAYESMAIQELAALKKTAEEKWPLTGCAIVHRVGEVAVAETSIALAVSSPHRKDAFAAAQWLMDRIKAQVPIWKKEQFTDGTTEWVHPESAE